MNLHYNALNVFGEQNQYILQVEEKPSPSAPPKKTNEEEGEKSEVITRVIPGVGVRNYEIILKKVNFSINSFAFSVFHILINRKSNFYTRTEYEINKNFPFMEVVFPP